MVKQVLQDWFIFVTQKVTEMTKRSRLNIIIFFDTGKRFVICYVFVLRVYNICGKYFDVNMS